MERVQRLYDCITEVSDRYIQEAEEVEIRQGKILDINWKRWSSIAAALVVVAGVGLAVSQMGGGGSSDASAPAASMPACSAPAASAPAVEDTSPMEPAMGESVENPLGDGVVSAALRGGGMILLSGEEAYVILTGEESKQLGLPEDLEQAVTGTAVCWLTLEEGVFVPAQKDTGIALYPCGPELYIVSDGEQYLAAASIQGR